MNQPLTWATARTLDQLGELTARWAEGAVAHPNGYDEPDTETLPLAATLAALNRAGLVTDFSQPGVSGTGWVQRAAVAGFCTLETSERLDHAIGPTELVLLTERPGGAQVTRIPVTLDSGRAHTWAGASPDFDDLRLCYQPVPRQGLAALANSWYVTVIDPIWGRNDALWPTLTTALRMTAHVALPPPFVPVDSARPSDL